MKNIHKINKNIYITNDEPAYPYALHLKNQEVLKINGVGENSGELFHDKGFSYPAECQKIILTDNKDLIKDGVQAIDDEFLEWFVKNPSCEGVGVEKDNHLCCKHCDMLHSTFGDGVNCDVCRRESNPYSKILGYKIIIPKEESKQDLPIVNGSYGCTIQTKKQEPKQETLEEVAEKFAKKFGSEIDSTRYYAFINGAKWQQERMYSEEEVIELVNNFEVHLGSAKVEEMMTFKTWFEQFKKK